MQTQTTTQAQLRVGSILSNIWRKESWRGLFAGNGANCVRVLPFSALVCLAYYNMAKVSVFISNPSLSTTGKLLQHLLHIIYTHLPINT